MKISLVFVLAILASMAVSQAAAAEIQSALINKQDAPVLVQQCSRGFAGKLEGGWLPSEANINELEKRMEDLLKLESELCCGQGKLERDLHEYIYQYGGIVVDGEKLIYINAIHVSKKSDNWKRTPIVYCDGGKSFWGAIFNPATGVFSDLAFNGDG